MAVYEMCDKVPLAKRQGLLTPLQRHVLTEGMRKEQEMKEEQMNQGNSGGGVPSQNSMSSNSQTVESHHYVNKGNNEAD